MRTNFKRELPTHGWHNGRDQFYDSYLAYLIVALMPPHLHYVEPFAGGLAVLFAKDANGVSEVVNDIDGVLMNFWRVLRDEQLFARFYRQAEATPLARAAWDEAKRHTPGGDSVADALAFFVTCRQSRSGLKKSFTPCTRSRTRRGMNGNVSEWLGAVDGLAEVHARLRRVFVESVDALGLIRREDGPDTLFYLDPPYLHETRTSRDAYAFEMTEAQHAELLDLILGVRGKVMLSGYPSGLYDAKLAGWSRHEFDLPNHAAGGKTKQRMTEVVWMNFQPDQPKRLDLIEGIPSVRQTVFRGDLSLAADRVRRVQPERHHLGAGDVAAYAGDRSSLVSGSASPGAPRCPSRTPNTRSRNPPVGVTRSGRGSPRA